MHPSTCRWVTVASERVNVCHDYKSAFPSTVRSGEQHGRASASAEGQPVQASDTIWRVMNFHIKIPEKGLKRFQTSQKKKKLNTEELTSAL